MSSEGSSTRSCYASPLTLLLRRTSSQPPNLHPPTSGPRASAVLPHTVHYARSSTSLTLSLLGTLAFALVMGASASPAFTPRLVQLLSQIRRICLSPSLSTSPALLHNASTSSAVLTAPSPTRDNRLILCAKGSLNTGVTSATSQRPLQLPLTSEVTPAPWHLSPSSPSKERKWIRTLRTTASFGLNSVAGTVPDALTLLRAPQQRHQTSM